MNFKDDEIECYMCGKIVKAPENILTYKGNAFCSASCLVGDVQEVEEVALLTAEDKECIVGDRDYEDRKGCIAWQFIRQ